MRRVALQQVGLGELALEPANQARVAHPGQRLIEHTKREQARRIRAGERLRRPTAFEEYLARRAADPSYTLRRCRRLIGGVIEE